MIRLGPLGRLLRLLYGLLYLPALPLIAWYWSRRPDSRARWREYFGEGPELAPGPAPVLVHCVSVGEVAAAVPVLRRLAARGHRIWLTTTIQDAEEAARRHGLPLAGSGLLPLDLPFAMARLVSRVRPAAVLVSETDLWPNMLLAFGGEGVPCFLVNGRISSGLARGWSWIRPLGAAALSAFRLAFVQHPVDGERLVAMGYPEDRIRVVGNTKYELAPPRLPAEVAELVATVAGSGRPVVVGGSTHAPEEEYLLDALPAAPGAAPLLVLAPRNPRRAGEVLGLVRARGIRVGLLSEVVAARGWVGLLEGPGPAALVVDGMGLLFGLYALANVAYVGGGFTPQGGHNLLEPAWHGVPVVGGPNWKNSLPDAEAFEAAGALTRGADRDGVRRAVWDLLADPARAEQAGLAGKRLLATGPQASEAVAAAVLAELEPAGPEAGPAPGTVVT